MRPVQRKRDEACLKAPSLEEHEHYQVGDGEDIDFVHISIGGNEISCESGQDQQEDGIEQLDDTEREEKVTVIRQQDGWNFSLQVKRCLFRWQATEGTHILPKGIQVRPAR